MSCDDDIITHETLKSTGIVSAGPARAARLRRRKERNLMAISIESGSNDHLPAKHPRGVYASIVCASLVVLTSGWVAADSTAGAAGATELRSAVAPVEQRLDGALEGNYLYKALMLRAAPGSLLTVIDLMQQRMPTYASFSEAGPFWMRHSQGDQWDLMLLAPMLSFEEYYSPDAVVGRERAYGTSGMSETEFERAIAPHIAWQEEWFVWGPSPEVLSDRFEDMDFFHVEIFLALADKRTELLEQRRMENDYLRRIGRQQNVIFTRAGGAAWDLFTLGFYTDIKQYAESADIPADLREEAARAAGFEGGAYIGSYLRSLIARHHDTLAVAIR